MNTFWVTFYSYKGGVGRTMALANVAAKLASEGRRVLLIDFDLEAPGLDAFDGLGCVSGHPGVVEYTSEYLSTGRAPDITKYVKECIPPNVMLRGKLWLMPSGKKDLQYNNDRAKIDWTALYDNFDGSHFIENWKKEIERTYSPDYVFVDSRTGLTDVGGICTMHFPRLVVLLFSLNDQNINGISNVARVLSDAETARPPQLLMVASPVPNLPTERTGLLKERLNVAERKLGIRPHCQLHYDPRVSLREQILVWKDRDARLVDEYNYLLESIINANVNGLDYLLKQSKRAIEDNDEERSSLIAHELKAEYPDRAESHYQISLQDRAFGNLQSAERNLEIAFETDPRFSIAFNELLTHLKSKKAFHKASHICQERLRLLDKHKLQYEQRSTLRELGEVSMASGDFKTAITCFGILIRIAKTESGIIDANLLSHAFNYAEARRRSGERVPITDLRYIIKLYERGAATRTSGTVTIRINFMQAMHIPYALAGDITNAKKLLEQVIDLCTEVSKLEKIFSVVRYHEVSTAEIRSEAVDMLESLQKKHLWDGTKLQKRRTAKSGK